MCYSAMVRSDYAKFVREYGAKLSLKNFYELFYRRLGDSSILIPKSVEASTTKRYRSRTCWVAK